MTAISDKVRYVRSQRQTRLHACHWPGCDRQVPPAKWGCSRHWYMLPKFLRDRIWETYEIGQEVNLSPSRDYLTVVRAVQAWIKEHYPDAA